MNFTFQPRPADLWSVFEHAFATGRGNVIKDFRFIPGTTPMSTFSTTLCALLTYYAVILGGRELMRTHEPFKLGIIFQAHNLFLSVLSGVLLLLFVEELVPTLYSKGVFHTICRHDGGWTDRLVVLYYLNYLVKYLELLDTGFLVLKKKPLTFLHTYHHGATVLLCYTQLVGQTPISWVPITLNLAVHVVMYYYYFQSARGIRVWWKQYITIIQIVQFFVGLGFICLGCYTHYVSRYWPRLPNRGACSKDDVAPITGLAILSSYLCLFIGFYASTYKKSNRTLSTAKGVTAAWIHRGF